MIHPTDVSITMLAIDNADVNNIVYCDSCPVGNVLQVAVSPKNTVFQTPVTVYLALRESLTGQSYDKDMLRVLKSSNESEGWQDITTEVELVYSNENVDENPQQISPNRRKAVYTEGAGPVCKCTGQCTVEGRVQGGG